MLFEESELIEGLRKGERNAYRFVFNNYYKLLCLYAASILEDDSLVEDVVQSTMVRIWEKRKEIQIQTSLQSYLYGAVRNTSINEIRKKRKERTFLDQLRYAALSEAIKREEEHIKEKLNLLEREIASLPEKSREVFLLNKKRGLSYAEIAEILGISERTVESHLARALKRIRANIGKMNYHIFL
ncbi:MAG: RNA polymerase sigma-70 factor [Bacteroidota bacterium]